MVSAEKIFLNWSGGKDSALSLYALQQQNKTPQALVTTIGAATQRITMHGVQRSLLEQQAKALGLPLQVVELNEQPGMEAYEESIHQSNRQLLHNGFTHCASGDLFLEDLKQYREGLYVKDGLHCLFPLWKQDTKALMQQFISKGFKAIVVCVNGNYLDESFCGRLIDQSFINDLPEGVDVCGENGEYHSFVFDGPIFQQPVRFQKSDVVKKEYPSPKASKDCFTTPLPATPFYFQELIPQQ
jgi:uncharacterized protein (TIGR00290 family)